MEDKDKVVAPVIPVTTVKVVEAEVIDSIAVKDEQIAKLTEERDNYKNVALKRLGKLPGDAAFLDKNGVGELTVAEQVRLALLDKEIDVANKAKENETRRILKENSELKLALKNRPSQSIGNGGGESPVNVKDNVLSEQQIATIKATAVRLKVKDVDAYVEKAKQNILNRR